MKVDFSPLPRWALVASAIASLLLPASGQEPAPGPEASAAAPTFSFSADNLPVKQALALFARANRLNIVPDLDVDGSVTVEFQDLPLDLAMRALLEANGCYFVQDTGLLRVRRRETRLFHIDYIHAVRTGQGSSAVQISSGAGASGGGGSSGGGGAAVGGASGAGGTEGSTMTVTANTTIDFWGGLETQIRSMISESGSVTINSLAGTVLVSDSHRNIETVARYIASISRSVVRQIDLEVRIFEVAFSDNAQLGVDWSRVRVPGVTRNYGTEFTTGLIIRNPAYGPAPLPPTLSASQDIVEKNILLVVEALAQQGKLQVVSQPRLRTLNNQPAVVRVGQDLPVFLRQSLASTGDNPVITENITIQTVTVGTVLSITPQVSEDGLVTLDLSPAVSRLVRMESSGPGANATTAPVIDIRQASSIVRVRDGDTVVMGGLVQESEASTKRGIPVLGDIPWLGRLFSADAKAKERTELVFFLTPRIVRDEPPKP
jgi:MSHA type pilus biogenesis protein MshL